jgi:hypothetical protein
MMMLEKNNAKIAGVIADWLTTTMKTAGARKPAAR